MKANDREPLRDSANLLGLCGIEFIEYATSTPQALGQMLETMGFRPVARHCSREVLLYRGRAQRAGGRLGHRGDYSFEVFNDDYQQIPPPTVAERARRGAVWLAEGVLHRSVPLPNQLKLRTGVR